MSQCQPVLLKAWERRGREQEVIGDCLFCFVLFCIFHFLTMNMGYFYNQREKTGSIKHCSYYRELSKVSEYGLPWKLFKDHGQNNSWVSSEWGSRSF